MKQRLEKLVRDLWRATIPIRRPFAARFDRHVVHLLHQVPRPPSHPADLDLILGSVLRDLTRLQVQVERLRQQIEAIATAEGEDRDEDRPSAVAGAG